MDDYDRNLEADTEENSDDFVPLHFLRVRKLYVSVVPASFNKDSEKNTIL